MRFIKFTLIILVLSAMVISCQKDQNVDLNLMKPVEKPDTGNFIAVKGTLKITINDSTYIFNAATDSIAFVNVRVDSNKYFGITAINKEHTMSFGISSLGSATSNISGDIAGGQWLFSADNKKGLQYSLAKYPDPEKPNKINLTQYMKDSVLTAGTFSAFMAQGTRPNAPIYKIQGTFNLQWK
jgi:hypothetical protein